MTAIIKIIVTSILSLLFLSCNLNFTDPKTTAIHNSVSGNIHKR